MTSVRSGTNLVGSETNLQEKKSGSAANLGSDTNLQEVDDGGEKRKSDTNLQEVKDEPEQQNEK